MRQHASATAPCTRGCEPIDQRRFATTTVTTAAARTADRPPKRTLVRATTTIEVAPIPDAPNRTTAADLIEVGPDTSPASALEPQVHSRRSHRRQVEVRHNAARPRPSNLKSTPAVPVADGLKSAPTRARPRQPDERRSQGSMTPRPARQSHARNISQGQPCRPCRPQWSCRPYQP
jgi:hypothetical protein